MEKIISFNAPNENSCCKSDRVLRHVVLFALESKLTEPQAQEVLDGLLALPSKIEEIKGCELGLNCSSEGLSDGLTHCFFLTFNSESDRDAYLVHPDHQEFVAFVEGKLSKLTVVDYWTK